MEGNDKRARDAGQRAVSASQSAKLRGIETHRGVRSLLRRAHIKGRKARKRWKIPLSEVRRRARRRAALRAENLFTAARAGRELGLSRQAVHQKILNGRLRSRMVGTRRLIPKSVLEEEQRRREHVGLWDLKNVSRALGMSYQQVYKLVKNGRLKSCRPGYCYFVPIEEARKFKDAGRREIASA